MPKKKKIPVHTSKQEAHLKDFFDMISPSTMQFNTDHFICGDTYRCVWAVREYPPQTSDQAILAKFGDRENVTLHIYSRFLGHRILQGLLGRLSVADIRAPPIRIDKCHRR